MCKRPVNNPPPHLSPQQEAAASAVRLCAARLDYRHARKYRGGAATGGDLSAKKPAMKHVKPAATLNPAKSFQDLIMTLQHFWAEQGCVILQPYDMEVGAGTFHPATTLRALGPRPWHAAFVQPSRRPKDGRYGENPNRLQHYYQFQVILKPSPLNIQELYLESLVRLGIDPKLHDIRFVEDDWESPTLGAWGLGWEVWCDGMEVSQFTYFQQVGGFDCDPVSGELTYGLERLAMYIQGVDSIYDLNYNGRDDEKRVLYGDVFKQAEEEYSRHNFEYADTAMLLQRFRDAEKECKALLAAGEPKEGVNGNRHLQVLPAYDQCIKASHIFNLLDARGVISVTERQSYILRVRDLAKACCAAWLKTEAAAPHERLPPAAPAPAKSAHYSFGGQSVRCRLLTKYPGQPMVLLDLPREEPALRKFHRLWEPIAQPVEHLTFNQRVDGSNPSGLTN